MVLTTFVALLLITEPGRMTNTSTSNLQSFHVLMDYGMRVLRADIFIACDFGIVEVKLIGN